MIGKKSQCLHSFFPCIREQPEVIRQVLTKIDTLLCNHRPSDDLPDIPSAAHYVQSSKLQGRIPRLKPTQEDIFRFLWSQGESLHVILNNDIDPAWLPDTLVAVHGQEYVDVHRVDSQGVDVVESMTLGDFFALFRKSTSEGSSLKLKDWPTSATFSSTWVTESLSFEKTLPFSAFTGPRGSANLPAHFARSLTNVAAHPPDLGKFKLSQTACHHLMATF